MPWHCGLGVFQKTKAVAIDFADRMDTSTFRLLNLFMKNYFLFILILISVTAFSQKGVKESCVITTPPVIDGKFDDWQSEWMLDPDGKFIYNVCNDANNLYVRIQVSDSQTQMKMGLFGFTLWLDPSGKKKEKYGLKFPVGVASQQKTLPELPENAQKGEIEKSLIKDVEVLELIGLAKENIFASRLGLMNGMQMMIIAQEDGTYQYEVKIPFKSFRINKSDVPVLGIGFETGVQDSKSKVQTANTGASPGSLSSINSGYGAMNDYYRRAMAGSRGGYTEMSVPTKLWFAIKLN